MGLAVPYTSYNRRWDPTNTSWGRELFWKPWKIEYDIPLTTYSLPSLWRPWRNNLSQQMSVSLYVRSIALSHVAHPSLQTFLRFISCDWKLSEAFISQIQFILFSGAVEFFFEKHKNLAIQCSVGLIPTVTWVQSTSKTITYHVPRIMQIVWLQAWRAQWPGNYPRF